MLLTGSIRRTFNQSAKYFPLQWIPNMRHSLAKVWKSWQRSLCMLEVYKIFSPAKPVPHIYCRLIHVHAWLCSSFTSMSSPPLPSPGCHFAVTHLQEETPGTDSMSLIPSSYSQVRSRRGKLFCHRLLYSVSVLGNLVQHHGRLWNFLLRADDFLLDVVAKYRLDDPMN